MFLGGGGAPFDYSPYPPTLGVLGESIKTYGHFECSTQAGMVADCPEGHVLE